jgi:hypothetical protein
MTWDHLPPDLAAKIQVMRAEAMPQDAKQRRIQAISASFWERV